MIRYNEIPVRENKVLVRCMTYNQCKYIKDALNGFVIQQTSFPFVCLVMDDASTDGEQDVIKDWMAGECDMSKAERYDIPEAEVVVVPHIVNDNCTMAFYFLKKNLFGTGGKTPLLHHWREHCEYEAICEGDDFWTDTKKLQKQVSFLDAHDDVVLSHTAFDYFIEETDTIRSGHDDTIRNMAIIDSGEDISSAILDGNRYRIQTMAVMLRTDWYTKADKDLERYAGKFLMGDTQLWIEMLKYGKVHFHEEVMGCYRIHRGSACRGYDMKRLFRFDLSCAEMRVTVGHDINVNKRLLDKFQWQYQKKLVKYLSVDRTYKPFVPVTYKNKANQLAFGLMNTNCMLTAIEIFYKISFFLYGIR